MKHTRLRRRYISLYASLLKSDPNRSVGDNKEVEELDRELDIDLILQWRYLLSSFLQVLIICLNHILAIFQGRNVLRSGNLNKINLFRD